MNQNLSFLKYTNGNQLYTGEIHAYQYIKNRARYLKQMNKNLLENGYDSYVPNIPNIKVKKFTPINLKNVTPIYQELISVICEYFSCRAIWTKVFPKGTIDPIQTFIIVGNVPDVYMCSKVLYFEINSIQMLHFNRIRYMRRNLHNRKRRGVKVKALNVRTTTSKYIRRLLYNIARLWERLLEQREMLAHNHKITNIYNYIRDNNFVDFGRREYKVKPNISRAFCRESKFVNKKILVYKKVTPFVY